MKTCLTGLVVTLLVIITGVCSGAVPSLPATTSTASAVSASAPTPTTASAPTSTATAVPAPTATAVTPVLPLTATDEEHFAAGEIKFGNGWTSIDGLFKDYQHVQANQKALTPKIDAAQRQVTDLQRQQNAIKSATTEQERPLKTDLVKQNARLREIQKVLDAPPPTLLQKPVPNAPTYRAGGYSPAEQNLMAEIQRITSANTVAKTKYQVDLKVYQTAQTAARKDFTPAKEAVGTLTDQIAKLESDQQNQLAPILAKQTPANAEVADLLRQRDTLDGRLKLLATALHGAPETVRFRRGIIEWKDTFSPIEDLEKKLADSQAEIERLREQMMAEAKAAGRPFSADWRHPSQDDLDALKALLDRARAERGKA
jgi:hypothetical protein